MKTCWNRTCHRSYFISHNFISLLLRFLRSPQWYLLQRISWIAKCVRLRKQCSIILLLYLTCVCIYIAVRHARILKVSSTIQWICIQRVATVVRIRMPLLYLDLKCVTIKKDNNAISVNSTTRVAIIRKQRKSMHNVCHYQKITARVLMSHL